jgi:hypothetical protein
MIGGGALTVRAGGVIATMVAASIALALLLAFLKFDRKLQDVTVVRLAMAAEEVRRQTETGLALGLDLAELEDLTDVLQRAAQARDVLRIDLWDEGGRVLFSSDPALLGTVADKTGLENDSSGHYRRRVHNEELTLTRRLNNSFGLTVGDVAVHATLAAQRRELKDVRRELLRSSVPLIALALAVTLLAVGLTVRLSSASAARKEDENSHENNDKESASELHLTLEKRLAAAIARAEHARREDATR